MKGELTPVEVGAMPDLVTQLGPWRGRWPPPPFWQSHMHVVHCLRGGEPLSPAPRTLGRVTEQSGTMICTSLAGGNIMQFHRITDDPRVMDRFWRRQPHMCRPTARNLVSRTA